MNSARHQKMRYYAWNLNGAGLRFAVDALPVNWTIATEAGYPSDHSFARFFCSPEALPDIESSVHGVAGEKGEQTRRDRIRTIPMEHVRRTLDYERFGVGKPLVQEFMRFNIDWSRLRTEGG